MAVSNDAPVAAPSPAPAVPGPQSSRASVTGHGFYDRDGDGNRNPRDTPVSWRSVWLFAFSGSIVKITQMDNKGFYSFVAGSEGGYCLRIPRPLMGVRV